MSVQSCIKITTRVSKHLVNIFQPSINRFNNSATTLINFKRHHAKTLNNILFNALNAFIQRSRMTIQRRVNTKSLSVKIYDKIIGARCQRGIKLLDLICQRRNHIAAA